MPVLVVETGNAFAQSDNLDYPTNPYIVQALELVGTHAINATLADVRRLYRMAELGQLPQDLRGHYISSTLEPEAAAPFRLDPYWIQPLSAGGKVVRVGVLALGHEGGTPGQQLRAVPPEEALRRYLPAADKESDLVVALARGRDEELTALAQRFPAIDVIISGSSKTEGRELPRVGNTVIVESSHDGIALGILELEWDAMGRIQTSKNQFMPLVPMVPDSPAMVEMVNKAHAAYSAFMEKEADRVPVSTQPSIFAGADACADCHEQAYKIWKNSGHARAIQALERGANLYNDKCLPCHVTGGWVRRGFVNMRRTPELANVQCEACHDASVAHSKNPQKIHPGTGALQRRRLKIRDDFCLRCHTPENSPNFKREVYWPKIKH